MKNKFKNIGFGLLSAVLLASAGCANFEEFKSETLESPAVLGMILCTVQDNSLEVNVLNPSDGYVTLGIIAKPAGALVFDSLAFFKQALTPDFTFIGKIVTRYKVATFTFDGLTPFTDYVVVGMSSNADGVLGKPVQLSAKTSDGLSPNYVESTPAIGDLATIIPTNGEIVLTFDEPVLYKSGNSLKYYYYYDDVTVQESDLDVVIDGNNVKITSKVPARNREIIFISWGEGAFTDLKGNKIEAMVSDLDEEGAPFGLFMRVVPKLFTPESITPTSGDTISAAGFTKIDLLYSEKVGGFHSLYLNKTTAPIKVTYKDVNGDTFIKVVPNDNVTFSANTATITLPLAPKDGQTVTLSMQSSTFKVGITNPTQTVNASWVMKP
jgi:Bacterial Ig-like domain